MKIKLTLLFVLIITVFQSICAQPKQRLTLKSGILKPRIVVLTDVSTWETDDSESLVRLLVHADLFEIEGLIYTTGWSLDKTRDDFFQLIHDAIDAYEKDLPMFHPIQWVRHFMLYVRLQITVLTTLQVIAE